jgi:hypothetical protein
VQDDQYPTVSSIGAELKIDQPQISHFLVRFFPQVFACHMSSVILTDIIQTVLETSECFLSKYTNNNMHILATGTEEQAVYSGYLWAPYSFKLLNTAPAIRRFKERE